MEMNTSPEEVTLPWHTLGVDAVMSSLHSPAQGLPEIEVERRLARYGPNELEAAHRVSPWAVLLGQFKNVLIVILLVATDSTVADDRGSFRQLRLM